MQDREYYTYRVKTYLQYSINQCTSMYKSVLQMTCTVLTLHIFRIAKSLAGKSLVYSMIHV